MRRRSRTPSWWSELPEPDDAGDPVELKVLLTDASRRAVRDAAERALPDRSVHYFDTPELDLARLGVVVRLRETDTDGRGAGDLTVKVRHAAPVRLPKRLRRDPDLAVEFDTLPANRHWSAALRRHVRPALLADVLDGRRRLADVFTDAQWRLYRMPRRAPGDAPEGAVPHPDRLRQVGPVRIRRRTLATLDCGPRVVAETCRYPDGTRLVEVSTKCSADQATLAAEEFTALLRDLDVDTARRQRTKTRTALELLTRRTA